MWLVKQTFLFYFAFQSKEIPIHFNHTNPGIQIILGLPWWLVGKESACNVGDCLQYRRRGFDPWVRKIPWKRKWQPTPVFLPGESHRQRNLAGYTVHGGCKELDTMAPHSSTLAWKIPWTEEPGRLQSMGSQRVRHDWATSLSLFTFMHWSRKGQPTPVFLTGES